MFSPFDSEEVEAYFNRLNAQLKRMPREDRAELHQELRQHLDALAAAHEELGATPEEAVDAALQQFGDPVKIGRRMLREWRHSRQVKFRGQGKSILVVGGLFSLLLPLASVFAPSWIGAYNIVLLPVLIGNIAGLCFGCPAIRSGFRTLLLILTLFTFFDLCAWWWSGSNVHSTTGFLGLYASCWLPLGSLSACLGGKAKAWIDKRRVSTS